MYIYSDFSRVCTVTLYTVYSTLVYTSARTYSVTVVYTHYVLHVTLSIVPATGIVLV